MPISKVPAFNLKAVLRETNLAADTLRAWERRYGLPMPQRSPGGHRLYSQYDIEMVKWLLARQNEGLSISRAVDRWKDEISQGREPLTEPASPRLLVGTPALQQPIYLPPETALDAMRSHWLAACLNYNEVAAEQTLNQAFGLYPVETVCLEILQRGMSELGGLWYEGRASVQQEHFASALAMRRLDTLLSSSPIPTRPQTILVGCPSDEWHTFTPLLLALFLRRRGLNVIYLGANVPADRFEETIHAIQPQIVILAAQQLSTAATLQQTAASLARHGVTLAFGGRIFVLQPNLMRSIPGHFLGNRLDTAIDNLEHLLEIKPEAPRIVTPPLEYLETLKHYITKRPHIEATLNSHLSAFTGSLPEYIEVANRFLGDNILACLQLGDMNYLTSEIDWLLLMLKSHPLPVDRVYGYLELYANAVQQHLEADATPIVNWLHTQIPNPNA